MEFNQREVDANVDERTDETIRHIFNDKN